MTNPYLNPNLHDYEAYPCGDMSPDWDNHVYCRDSRRCEWRPRVETFADILPRVLDALKNPCRHCGCSVRGYADCEECEARM